MIYLDLKRLDCTIHYYLTAERYEIDFLAITPRGEKKLFQIFWDIQDTGTLAREERVLQAGIKA